MYENEQKKIFFYRLKNQSHSLWDLHLSIDFRLNSEFVNDFKNEKKIRELHAKKNIKIEITIRPMDFKMVS